MQIFTNLSKKFITKEVCAAKVWWVATSDIGKRQANPATMWAIIVSTFAQIRKQIGQNWTHCAYLQFKLLSVLRIWQDPFDRRCPAVEPHILAYPTTNQALNSWNGHSLSAHGSGRAAFVAAKYVFIFIVTFEIVRANYNREQRASFPPFQLLTTKKKMIEL